MFQTAFQVFMYLFSETPEFEKTMIELYPKLVRNLGRLDSALIGLALDRYVFSESPFDHLHSNFAVEELQELVEILEQQLSDLSNTDFKTVHSTFISGGSSLSIISLLIKAKLSTRDKSSSALPLVLRRILSLSHSPSETQPSLIKEAVLNILEKVSAFLEETYFYIFGFSRVLESLQVRVTDDLRLVEGKLKVLEKLAR